MAVSEKTVEFSKLGATVAHVPPLEEDVPPGSLGEESPPKADPTPATPPPDGGLVAWLQVAGSFALYFNTL